jgi:hypothetical protein
VFAYSSKPSPLLLIKNPSVKKCRMSSPSRQQHPSRDVDVHYKGRFTYVRMYYTLEGSIPSGLGAPEQLRDDFIPL